MLDTLLEGPDEAGLPAQQAWVRAAGQGPVRELWPAPWPVVRPRALSTRQQADAYAAWLRGHAVGVDASSLGEGEPVWWAWERARCDHLAAQMSPLPGVRGHLAGLEALAPADSRLAALYVCARQALAGLAAPVQDNQALWPSPAQPLWRRWLPGSAPAGAPARSAWWQAVAACQALSQDGPTCWLQLQPLLARLAQAWLGLPSETNPSQPEQSDPDAAQRRLQADARAVSHGVQLAAPLSSKAAYFAHDRAHDETAPYTRWWQPADREYLSGLSGQDRQRMKRLSHRLQRQVQARALPHWEFDQEEGVLDPRRLSALLTSPPPARVFRREVPPPQLDVAITLLVDLSGSMKGERQRLAALAIDLAVHTLEACHLPVEVLGHTTVGGLDNPVHRAWQAAGCPAGSGRLNALRQVVFKTRQQPWRQVRDGLGLMLRPGFGQENLDGEALDWAARRLAKSPNRRKLLLVLADGAPYDRATAQHHGRAWMEAHLHQSVRAVEAAGIELWALGATDALGRFYRRHQVVAREALLGEALFQTLSQALLPPRPGQATPERER